MATHTHNTSNARPSGQRPRPPPAQLPAPSSSDSNSWRLRKDGHGDNGGARRPQDGGEEIGVLLLHQLHGQEDNAGEGAHQSQARRVLGQNDAARAGQRHRQRHDGSPRPSAVRDAQSGAGRSGLLPQTAHPDGPENRPFRGRGEWTPLELVFEAFVRL